MNAIDATDRNSKADDAEPPSLLTIIIDTNPHAWNLLHDALPLSKVIVNTLVLINAHLAINHANKVAVLASHCEKAVWLYPAAKISQTEPESETGNGSAANSSHLAEKDAITQPLEDANKYRPFAHLENVLTYNLRKLLDTTTAHALSSSPTTMMAGALTMALNYISKQSATLPTGNSSAQFNYSDPNAVAGGNDVAGADPSRPHAGSMSLVSRILILSVSGDLANQYIPIMNAIFACQRLNIPIDILKLAGDTVFLQQAADATGGVYMALDATTRAGLLQYLMFAYLPDQTARQHLVMPGDSAGVDFRAACFCHRRIVDIGYVCSICLSIFCGVLADGQCLTCGSQLRLTNYGNKPAVVPKKKAKKKKRPMDGAAITMSGTGTPISS
jgi:transcription initiation factor TFIIH subunit 3